ncbi:hypothetical protein GH714_028338 [Hevea brasiliensis]|uniref:Phospholipid-transporting ATPase n=1 Tax=Hevea brasiliensis TaxID=3981 RepID=A0A6A6LCW6_HEVBR|nr:hypothetical protein GH714_028338 [Hevea brasiliensis]
MAGGRRKKHHFSRIHAFPCGKASFESDLSLIGGPGFSRVIYCNDPECFEAGVLNYGKTMLELPTVSNVVPLVVVIGATMGKELIEDWRRKRQDIEVNNRKVKVRIGDGVFHHTKWMNLKVGDIVKVEKDEFFPADIILLSSSYDEAICYVETMNLDGETNLKLKQALHETSNLHDDSSFQDFKALIRCEDPNANLYSFVGNLELREQQHPLSPLQLLLRDSKLRNTDYIYGVVIFTGTLTCNSMEFIKFSVAGTSYGRGVTEVGRAMAKRKGSPLPQEVIQEEAHVEEQTEQKPSIKGFNFVDGRITDGHWVNEPRADVIQKFVRLLAICHTAIPEIDEETGKVTYEAESPDEAAFLIAARELGFEFYGRTQTSISLHELDPVAGRTVERNYQLLHIIEFSSSRKRMSVIVRNEEGKLLLLSKGADREFQEQTKEHINEYADAGLRTLVLAYRELDEEEYSEFNQEFTDAKNSVSSEREEMIEEVAAKIERDLILLGATAVEDKLQNGVPECIDKLAQAGIKIWVLTGDKMETAINIGFACSLLRQGMKQVIISSEAPENKGLQKMEDKAAAAAASKASILRQISEGKALLTASSESPEALALIIDGYSLAYALQDDVKDKFLELAIGCASVICCRSSPKQKALVTRLVKTKTGNTTLAIGDGANDVGMLQEADIGVGISGVEGMQAVMSSDFAIAQFQYLERLLLVHGHWCYRRISSMICYFFYKNIAFGFTLFFYEAYASFSGQPAYNDWFLSLYNVFFTSLPVIALGVFDQDVSARFCLKFPLLYQEGVQNVLFSWRRIFGWAFNGVLSAILIFFFSISAMEHQAFNKDGSCRPRDPRSHHVHMRRVGG